MNFAKTCLAVLIGVIIGASFMALVHPQPVKAQGKTVFIDVEERNPNTVRIRGSQVVGFACISREVCLVASQ